MVQLSDGVDPEAPGSRYTSRVALAFVPTLEEADRAARGDQATAPETVDAHLGEPPDEELGLGELRAIDGSRGRGAAGWIAVAEWTADAIGQGIVGGAAWITLLSAGRWLRERVRELGHSGQRVMVSRGGAILIAAAYVMDEASEDGPLGCEAAEDPVSMSGDQPSETGYAGVEPWIVSLVRSSAVSRHIEVVSEPKTA